MPKLRDNNATAFVSIYLEAVGVAGLPAGWSRSAKVTAAIENGKSEGSITRSQVLTFDSELVDNGWNEFIPLTRICEEGAGFLKDGALVVSIRFEDVRVK